MKYSDLKAIFAEEQTSRGLLVIGIDPEGRRVEAVFHILAAPKSEWEAISIRYL